MPDPKIEHPCDAIIRVTACAICGSDLHLFDGVIPTMKPGDVLGHETMGEVVEVGSEAGKLKKAIGWWFRSPSPAANAFLPARLFLRLRGVQPERQNGGRAVGPLTGRSVRLFASVGGFPGGQAKYLRVPYADVGPIKVPEGLSDEQVLFLSDIFPTSYMGAEFCDIKGGETIAVFGCGPVAQFSIRSAFCSGPSA